jgi:isopenicillin N synthase-like dioxygenase
MPCSLAAHELEIATFFTACHSLCLRILTLLGLGLHIPASSGGASWFASRHLPSLGPSGATLRLLYYPSVPDDADYQPDIDIRAGAHSDYGSVTLLFQRPGQPGLEILTRSGEWYPVPVSPPGTESDPSPPILVNMGDLFEFWTNGLFRSAVHRVVFPKEARRGGEDRYSIAFFCHPVDDTILEAVPSEMVRSRKPVSSFGHGNGAGGAQENGKVITAKEHLLQRLQATYLSLYDKERNAET